MSDKEFSLVKNTKMRKNLNQNLQKEQLLTQLFSKLVFS